MIIAIIWSLLFLWLIIYFVMDGFYGRLWPSFLGAGVSLAIAGVAVYGKFWNPLLIASIVFLLGMIYPVIRDYQVSKKKHGDEQSKGETVTTLQP